MVKNARAVLPFALPLRAFFKEPCQGLTLALDVPEDTLNFSSKSRIIGLELGDLDAQSVAPSCDLCNSVRARNAVELMAQPVSARLGLVLVLRHHRHFLGHIGQAVAHERHEVAP